MKICEVFTFFLNVYSNYIQCIVFCYGSLSREASSNSVSRFLGSKLRSEGFTELGLIGLSRGECVFKEVCEGVCKEVCEGVCAGLQVGSGVEVLPTENLA